MCASTRQVFPGLTRVRPQGPGRGRARDEYLAAQRGGNSGHAMGRVDRTGIMAAAAARVTEDGTLVGCTVRRPNRQTARGRHGERSGAMTCRIEHKFSLEAGGATHGVCGIANDRRLRFLVIPQSGVVRSLLGALWHDGTQATSSYE